MPANLPYLIAATAQWLVRAYPAPGGAFDATLVEVQARQAATVAAWLRYPTMMDAALVGMVGPGGSARLDWLVGADVEPVAAESPGAGTAAPGAGTAESPDAGHAWRTWVDEVVASWAACLLTSPELADAAVAAVRTAEHMAELHGDFRRLTRPDAHDRRAAALLRHPDLVAPVADLHRPELLVRLGIAPADAA